MIEYIVDKRVVDLSDETKIELTISVNDIRNPITFNNTWSTQFDIPGTTNNNEIFSHIYDNNIEVGYNPNIKKDFEIRINSIPVISGYQKINDIVIEGDKITYKVVCYGNNTTIFEDMGDELITDLDLSSHNHTYTAQNIRLSWDHTNESGYYYPFINYSDQKWGWEEIKDNADDYDFFPSFPVKTIIDKIFETYNYTYDSQFFNSDLFKSLHIPFTNSISEQKTELLTTNEIWEVHYDDDGQGGIIAIDNYSLDYKIDPLNLYTTLSSYSKLLTPASGIWTMKVVGQNTVGTNYYFTGASFAVYSKRVDIPGQPQTLEYSRTITSQPDPQGLTTFDFEFTFPKILKDREIRLSVFPLYQGDEGHRSQVNMEITWELQTDRFFKNLTQVRPQDTLPKIKQRDLFDALNKMFNLYVERNSDNPSELIIEPFNEYYARSTDTVDWTYKIDNNSKKYKLMSELNANFFRFKYTDDDDYLNETYTESLELSPGEITTYVQSNFIKKNVSVEVPSSPSIIDNFADNKIYPSIYEEGDEEIQKITTSWNWRILSKNRIITSLFQYDGVSQNRFPTLSHIVNYDGTVKAYDSLWFETTDNSFTWDLDATTLYDKNWESYLNLIKNQNSKLLTVDTYLTERDISNLRFYEKIFIEDNYYYLNKIIFNPGSRKSVSELLLIPSTDIKTLFYQNFQFFGQSPYVELDEVVVKVDIQNYSQQPETWSGYFYIKDEQGGLIDQIHRSGNIRKNYSETIEETITLNETGVITIGFTDGYDYDDSVVIFVAKEPYDYSNLRQTNNGLYTGFNINILFDIEAVESTHIGSTSGTILHQQSGISKNWTWSTNGLDFTTISLPFNLTSGLNTFEVHGDWEDTIQVHATDPAPVILDGGWTYNPPSGWEQGDTVEVNWTIYNTGQIPATGVNLVIDITYDSNGLNPINSYSPITLLNQTIPLGGRVFTFTLDNLPFDEPDPGNDIYMQTPIYIFAELSPYLNGFTSLIISPCTDNLTGDLSTSPINITGDTTAIKSSYDINNLSCKEIQQFSWLLRYEYYDVKLLPLSKITTPYHTYSGFFPNDIPSGGKITISEFYTSYTPPNTWLEGEKTVKIKALGPGNVSIELLKYDYNYWVGQPNIEYVSSNCSGDSGQQVYQLNLTAINTGNATGKGFINGIFKRPNGSTIVNATSPIHTWTQGQTNTHALGAYSFTTGVYGNYSIDWTFRKSPGGAILFSGTDTMYRPIYTLNFDSQGRLVWTGGGAYGGTKRFSVGIKITAVCFGTSFTNGEWYAQATGNLSNNSTTVGTASALCQLIGQLGQDCSDTDTTTVNLTNISLGNNATGNTSIDTNYSIFCEQGQFGESGGYVEYEIVSITKTSGDIQVVGVGNKRRFECP